MKRLATTALLLVTVIAMMSGPVSSQGGQQWVTAKGVAAIINDDVGGGRDKALEDARRKAVEHVVGVMLDSETLVENFQLVQDRIYSQSAGYICGEEIVEEHKDKYNYYITLKACVAEGNLEDNLLAIGICLRRLENPRTMLMIGEQNVGDRIHGWWQGSDLSIVESTLMEAFNDKGFPLIDPSVAQGNIRATKAISGDPDPNDAVRVGKIFDAEYVVIGKALVTCKSKDQYGFYHCYANITTRIVKVDNGRIFGSASARAKQAHIEEHESGARALRKAADKIAPMLIKKITSRCEKETTGGNEFKVLLSNVSSYGKLKTFINQLSNARGVGQVSRRSFSGGRAELEVMYKGRAGDLAEAIETSTGAAVTDFSANTVKARLK